MAQYQYGERGVSNDGSENGGVNGENNNEESSENIKSVWRKRK